MVAVTENGGDHMDRKTIGLLMFALIGIIACPVMLIIGGLTMAVLVSLLMLNMAEALGFGLTVAIVLAAWIISCSAMVKTAYQYLKKEDE